ncbi:MAG: AtpZ/AtpI family protein [Negativicutes bacterium]|nr:AtpZ/AtpI family protein [Negativicutes bacterium]
MPEQGNGKKQVLNALSLVGTIGISLVVNVGVGLFAGRLVDGWLNMSPWGTLAGTLLGVMAGFWSIYKRISGNG